MQRETSVCARRTIAIGRTARAVPAALLLATPVFAQQTPAECNASSKAAVVKIQLPGHPFEAIASRDGCWVFASLRRGPNRSSATRAKAGIAVLRRSGGDIALQRVAPLSPAEPAGIALTHDGKVLIVADGRYVQFLDTNRLVHGERNPVLGSIRDGVAPGSAYLMVTSDDRTLFVSDESLNQVTVIDLRLARRTGFHHDSIIGAIPTGRAPGGLAISRDRKYLFVTSEVWLGRSGWPADCRPERRAAGGPLTVPEGAVEIVDVAQAQRHPVEAIIGRASAGCSPVRTVLSPDGRWLYVTARGSNALLVFNESRLIADPAHALMFTVPVGSAPVGLDVVDHGRKIIVANSSRFGGNGGQDLAILDASKVGQGRAAVQGTLPTGAFPRELHTTADGKSLLLTNFGSDQIELLAIEGLGLQ